MTSVLPDLGNSLKLVLNCKASITVPDRHVGQNLIFTKINFSGVAIDNIWMCGCPMSSVSKLQFVTQCTKLAVNDAYKVELVIISIYLVGLMFILVKLLRTLICKVIAFTVH